MAFYVTLYSNQQIECLTTAELATWIASNPIDGAAVCDIDNLQLVYFNDPTQTAIPFVSGGGITYTKYVKNYSGSSYINTDLIGATITLFLMDNLVRYSDDDMSIDPGNEFSFDSSTGTIDIGTNFDENNLLIQYRSITAPVSP